MSNQEFVKHATLAEALRAAMSEVSYVQRTVKVDTGGGRSYVAAGEADIIAGVRSSLVKHGVIGPVPLAIESINVTDCQTKSGGVARHAVLVRKFRVYHADSQDTMDVVAAGEAVDSGLADKATAKAMTQAKTYALRELMLVECGNDPEYLASECGADNAPEFRRAATSIESAANVEALDKIARFLVKPNDEGNLLFDEEQLEKLNRRIDERRRSFPGQVARPK